VSEPNPYWWAHRRRQTHRREHEGALRTVLTALIPLAVAAVLVPVVRPVFLGFLDEGPDALASGLQGIVLRLGLLIVAVTALDVYAALIRSDERAILDLHPVDSEQVSQYLMVRTERERWWVPVAAAILLLPVAFEGSLLSYASAIVALGAINFMAFRASTLMHLGAVSMAESERAAPFLDLLRGSNPRAQAAFLYAPGAVLGATAGAVWLASLGVYAGAAALSAGMWMVLIPVLVGGLASRYVGRMSQRSWFRASPVLADIDARYSALEQEDDGLRVYLEFTLRWLPERLALYVEKDLRHGWRQRRTGVTLAWAVGVLSALAGWSGSESAPVTSMVVGVLGVFALALNGVLMESDQPAFLREWLSMDARAAMAARGITVFGWLQAAVWLPLPVVWLRHGGASAATSTGLVFACSIVAAVLVALCSRRPRWGLWVYLPVVAGIAGVVVTATRLGGVL
jgi:hypothetical protein